MDKNINHDQQYSDYHIGECGDRPWGNWQVLDLGNEFSVKRLAVYPGKRVSLQYHNFRSELWNVVSGIGLVTVGGDEVSVEKGRQIYIPKKVNHRVWNTGTENLIIIEIQYGVVISEEDIVRLQDDYQRVLVTTGM